MEAQELRPLPGPRVAMGLPLGRPGPLPTVFLGHSWFILLLSLKSASFPTCRNGLSPRTSLLPRHDPGAPSPNGLPDLAGSPLPPSLEGSAPDYIRTANAARGSGKPSWWPNHNASRETPANPLLTITALHFRHASLGGAGGDGDVFFPVRDRPARPCPIHLQRDYPVVQFATFSRPPWDVHHHPTSPFISSNLLPSIPAPPRQLSLPRRPQKARPAPPGRRAVGSMRPLVLGWVAHPLAGCWP